MASINIHNVTLAIFDTLMAGAKPSTQENLLDNGIFFHECFRGAVRVRSGSDEVTYYLDEKFVSPAEEKPFSAKEQ